MSLSFYCYFPFIHPILSSFMLCAFPTNGSQLLQDHFQIIVGIFNFNCHIIIWFHPTKRRVFRMASIDQQANMWFSFECESQLLLNFLVSFFFGLLLFIFFSSGLHYYFRIEWVSLRLMWKQKVLNISLWFWWWIGTSEMTKMHMKKC